jgi:hypothetical protein
MNIIRRYASTFIKASFTNGEKRLINLDRMDFISVKEKRMTFYKLRHSVLSTDSGYFYINFETAEGANRAMQDIQKKLEANNRLIDTD